MTKEPLAGDEDGVGDVAEGLADIVVDAIESGVEGLGAAPDG